MIILRFRNGYEKAGYTVELIRLTNAISTDLLYLDV